MNCRYFIAVNELSLQHFGVNGDLATLATTRTTITVMMKLKCESKNVNANKKNSTPMTMDRVAGPTENSSTAT